MKQGNLDDLGHLSMADLFRREVESQLEILTRGLLALETQSGARQKLEELMRAAHSLKGAARIVGCKAAVRIAHAMEDSLVAAQKNGGRLSAKTVDAVLGGIDLLTRIALASEERFENSEIEHQVEIRAFLNELASSVPTASAPHREDGSGQQLANREPDSTLVADQTSQGPVVEVAATNKSSAGLDRFVRVTPENLNNLLGLASETLVSSRSLNAFSTGLLRMKQLHTQLLGTVDQLRDSFPADSLNSRAARRLGELQELTGECHRFVLEALTEADLLDRRLFGLSSRLYTEVLNCRMRPFAEGTQAFRRGARDLGRSLGKVVLLEVLGESTPVDRDILERVKAPMDHLLRNAIDHGIELPSERLAKGKPEAGKVQIEARHSAGKLLIIVADDGRGIELEAVRQAVVERKLTTIEAAQKMNDAELFEFLFLPGFTLRERVSEISGRGVGLDVVQSMVREVGGNVRVSSHKDKGTRFQLELPLTLSIVRILLVEIAGEPYALSLARIDRALKLPVDQIQSIEGRQHFTLENQQIGLVTASEILELESQPGGSEVSVIVLGDKSGRYGLVVDRFLGEQDLVVRELDRRLGKVKNISAGALMPDGFPVLIIDVDDLIRHVESLVSSRRLSPIGPSAATGKEKQRKRILVVDDSLNVREVERKLLDTGGYAVDVAVDGMEGWNAVRTAHYDLVVTDVDMPRMDGIELVNLIRKDARLKSLPVMIVSYKDREEDRQRGLQAGADYYLTKGSFHDETLIRAVTDLIGTA